jgi:hypothetical protein
MKDGETIRLYYVVHIEHNEKYLTVYNAFDHENVYKLKDIASFTITIKKELLA